LLSFANYILICLSNWTAGAGATAASIDFELRPIENVSEALTITANSHLGSLIPMGSVIPGFHNISTSDAVDASGHHIGFQVFIQNRSGEGENGCISRNDGILVPLHILIGCTSYGRDVHYFSTPRETRPDFTGLYHSVQVVIAEEKDDSIASAVNDLVKKFRFIYNYSPQISVMFGFAISRNDFRIYKFERNPLNDVPLRCSEWFTSALNSVSNRMKCILAALNVGRVLKFYREKDFLIPATIPQGIFIQRAQPGKMIKICYDYVIVKSTETEERLAETRLFYNATAEVIFLEHLYLDKKHHDGFYEGSNNGVKYLNIYLKPFGQTYIPESPQELQRALLCVLQCIKALHSANYFHTDIRWPNIVRYELSFFLIDCYDFCEVSDHDRLVTTKRQRSGDAAVDVEWCAADDLLQVIALANAQEFHGDTYSMFAEVRASDVNVASGEASVDDVIRLVDAVTFQ
jgi:hypothetical protein